jgi:hypothetical protein
LTSISISVLLRAAEIFSNTSRRFVKIVIALIVALAVVLVRVLLRFSSYRDEEELRVKDRPASRFDKPKDQL